MIGVTVPPSRLMAPRGTSPCERCFGFLRNLKNRLSSRGAFRHFARNDVPSFSCRAVSVDRNVTKIVDTGSTDEPWLLVGLGNPGANYEKTRHNVGFMMIDELARQNGIDMRKLQHSAAVGTGHICGKKVLLAKPMTFMNNSGESVGALARYFKIPKERVVVVYDDLDLPTAQVRLRGKGGHGGHNGMRSIVAHLSGKEFPRLKIGIGRPNGSKAVRHYVLEPFNKKEKEEIEFAIIESIDKVTAILTLGLEKALSGAKV